MNSNLFNINNKEDKDNKNNNKTIGEVITIYGPNFGEQKTIKITPGGTVTVIKGGIY